MNVIEIWEPRWHDRKVLIATRKVWEQNIIRFTKTGAYKGDYILSGEEIKKYPVGTNGKIPCYEVPLSEFEPDMEETTAEDDRQTRIDLFIDSELGK